MGFKIGVDISGGDRAPDEIIKGSILAQKEFQDDIILFGPEKEIRDRLAFFGHSAGDFSIVDAPEKIEMADSPVTAVRKKKQSSIALGVHSLKNRSIDAFVSCGNTGAVVSASTLILGLLEGVERPGIALVIPAQKGFSLLIDVGANVDCKPLHFLQFGIMASVFSSRVLNRENPSVGLLNIGGEGTKCG